MLPDYRVRQRDYLIEIIRALTQQLDLETVLTRILEVATEMLAGQAALVALRDADKVLRVHIQYRVTPEFVKHFDSILRDVPPDRPERGDTTRFVISEIERRLVTVGQRFDLSGTVGLPLQAGDELVGLLLVFRSYSNPFGANDRQLLQAFADQAAVAVNNARLYEQTANERRRLDAILEGSADGIAILDPGHHIAKWNRALTRLTQVGAANAIGKPYEEVMQWAKLEPGMDLADAEAGGWPFSSATPLYVEGDLRRADGSTVAVGVTYAPILDKTNRLVNIVASVRDITKFREAEELKSTFISVISHELKTPVSLIKGYAGTLRRDDVKWDSRTVQESLTVIEEEADRLTHLIENLLDASRLQAGALKLTISEVALDEMAAALARDYRTQTDVHEFVVNFPQNFPLISGDEERLRQVMTNLISNAIKYSPEGGTITIAGKVEPEQIIISVTDPGKGLPAEELTKVFDRFYRAATTATRKAQGAGLGLYLAKAVVEAHGGQIWASSEPGEGATFHFSLPRP